MKVFTYDRAASAVRAAAASARPGAKVIAGGTNLLRLTVACVSVMGS